LSAGRRPSSSCRNCPQVPAFGNCAGHVTEAVAARAAAVTKLRASAFGHVDEMPMRSQLSSTCGELERVVTGNNIYKRRVLTSFFFWGEISPTDLPKEKAQCDLYKGCFWKIFKKIAIFLRKKYKIRQI
jgi:hypothetical protein